MRQLLSWIKSAHPVIRLARKDEDGPSRETASLCEVTVQDVYHRRTAWARLSVSEDDPLQEEVEGTRGSIVNQVQSHEGARWAVDGILLTAQLRTLEGRFKDDVVGDLVLALTTIVEGPEESEQDSNVFQIRIEARVKDLSLRHDYVATPEMVGEICSQAFTEAIAIHFEGACDEEMPLRQSLLVG